LRDPSGQVGHRTGLTTPIIVPVGQRLILLGTGTASGAPVKHGIFRLLPAVLPSAAFRCPVPCAGSSPSWNMVRLSICPGGMRATRAGGFQGRLLADELLTL
jgi:hypothetical protein